MSRKEILEELSFFYTEEVLRELKTHKQTYEFFLKHIDLHQEEISPAELFENGNFHDSMILVNTPDGFFQMGDVIKKYRDCEEVVLENGKKIECSHDHLIETSSGWKKSKDLSNLDNVITDKGLSFVRYKKQLGYQAVYDIEIQSEFHRYWNLEGISSHNTAKTFVACYTALDLLKEGIHKRIILARPAVEAGENLGFLPGTPDEKIAPYMKGYISNMEKILVSSDKLGSLVSKKTIVMEPLAFMRSQTFDDTILILDEAQNADLRQIMLVVTRMGKNSRIVICGDVTQWDIKNRSKDLLAFYDHIAKDVDGCDSFTFTREDIVRNPILIGLTDKYDEYKRKEVK